MVHHIMEKMMTVAELKMLLEDLPDDSPVFYPGGEYLGDWRKVTMAHYVHGYDYHIGEENPVILK